MEKNPNSFLSLPGAIIIAGTIIAIAIIYTTRKPAPVTAPTPAAQANVGAQLAQISMRTIDKNDHILGDPNAPVKIVEYSDPSCPYCKVFNATMVQVMDTYGASGKVAWVYRSFPLDKPTANGQILHPNAGRESQALECAAYVGGNEKFWAYQKRLYTVTPAVTPQSPKGLDPSQLPEIAKYVGIDTVAFNDCLSSGRFKEKVEADYLDGVNAGVTGTPYSIIITPSGNKIPVEGIRSFATFKGTIDALLAGQ